MSILALGPAGTNGHEAAERLKDIAPALKEHEIVFCRRNREILEGVASGRAKYGVAPIENNSTGFIPEVVKYWREQNPEEIKRRIYVIGEIVIHIRHCLMAASGVALEEVKLVTSHGEALRQCTHTLDQLRLHNQRPSLSTAAAAKEAAENASDGVAAIASEFAARIHGLNILQNGVQDENGNATRFHLLGSKPAHSTGNDRTAMLFWLPDRPGALHRALGPMDDADLNMACLHSIPLGPNGYAFYAEFDGHQRDAKVKAALRHLRASLVEKLFVLGSYPRANGNCITRSEHPETQKRAEK
jgi:chorismate mutase/prephenate dehydratase